MSIMAKKTGAFVLSLTSILTLSDVAQAFPHAGAIAIQQQRRSAEEPREPARDAPRIGNAVEIDVVAGQAVEIPIDLGDWAHVAFTLISSIPDFTIAPDRASIVGVPTAPPGTVYELQLIGRWPGGAVVTASRKAFVTVRSVAE